MNQEQYPEAWSRESVTNEDAILVAFVCPDLKALKQDQSFYDGQSYSLTASRFASVNETVKGEE